MFNNLQVTTLLRKQTDMIKAFNKMNAVKNVPASPDVSPVKIPADKKTVNLAPTISNLQNDILEDTKNLDTDDGDSRDNEDLVIDMKEDEYENSNEDKSENDKRK